MNRRNAIMSLSGTAAVAVAGLALSTPAAFGQPAHEGHKPGAPGDHWDRCIHACTASVIACGKARQHCVQLAQGGKGEHAPVAALTADCADCCALCLALVSRKSQISAAVADGCAKCCDKCAAECDKMTADVMKDCAKVLRECAAACREMAKM